MELIKSISFDQSEIINNIIQLYCPDGIELDSTYSVGNFYKNTGIKPPTFKFDKYPQVDGVQQADAINLPVPDNWVKSYMFDPPFVAASQKDGKNGVIKSRFGYYKTIPELWEMYKGAIKEAYRVLAPNGVFIFKYQDSIDSSKQYFSHRWIMNEAVKVGFYPKDLFILLAKNRLIGSNCAVQQHARKFHSYFWVFIKQNSKVTYDNVISAQTQEV